MHFSLAHIGLIHIPFLPLDAAAHVFPFSVLMAHLTIHFVCVCVVVHLTFPLWVIVAQVSCWAELKFFNIVWILAMKALHQSTPTAIAIQTPSTQLFPMIMNGNVQHVSIHLSHRFWWLIKPQKCVVWLHLKPGCCNLSISRCIGCPRYKTKKETLSTTPYQTCRHEKNDKGLWFGQKCRCSRVGQGVRVLKRGGGERGRNMPVSRMACPTNALCWGPKLPPTQWSYSQLRCPPHWQAIQKPRLTSP